MYRNLMCTLEYQSGAQKKSLGYIVWGKICKHRSHLYTCTYLQEDV